MIFCSKCFRDPEIVSIIEQSGHTGDCPICKSQNVSLYDTAKNESLIGMFDNLLYVYTPKKDLPDDYPQEDADLLANVLLKDWEIFGDITPGDVISILKELAPTVYADIPSLFDSPVGILERMDIEYLREHSILKAQEWTDFVETIKHKNRFHANLINTELLREYCIQIPKSISMGKQRFYRARIARNPEGFSRGEMGAPPKEKSTEGRANSTGISRLYLTYDKETTLHEIRAAEYDYVTIATFKQQEDIRVVDLKRISQISPFGPDVDCTALAINRKHLQRINQEMSKTMRRGDSTLDYLPTQYICDFIMSILDEDGSPMFDGIEYKSAMRSSGANLAIFYPEKFKCTYHRTYEITALTYHKKVSGVG